MPAQASPRTSDCSGGISIASHRTCLGLRPCSIHGKATLAATARRFSAANRDHLGLPRSLTAVSEGCKPPDLRLFYGSRWPPDHANRASGQGGRRLGPWRCPLALGRLALVRTSAHGPPRCRSHRRRQSLPGYRGWSVAPPGSPRSSAPAQAPAAPSLQGRR